MVRGEGVKEKEEGREGGRRNNHNRKSKAKHSTVRVSVPVSFHRGGPKGRYHSCGPERGGRREEERKGGRDKEEGGGEGRKEVMKERKERGEGEKEKMRKEEESIDISSENIRTINPYSLSILTHVHYTYLCESCAK